MYRHEKSKRENRQTTKRSQRNVNKQTSKACDGIFCKGELSAGDYQRGMAHIFDLGGDLDRDNDDDSDDTSDDDTQFGNILF